jgi:tRNA threonylcarbamoyladenosine biosynthesis protein TsaB
LATLLFIDTAGENALVGVSQNNLLLAMEENTTANTHANFVQVAVESVLKKGNITIQALDAIVVTMGPGSYTGLRVGLASAKGIAYVLNKPIIGLSTLALLAKTAIETKICAAQDEQLQIFSMIDARRMEVFGAIYDKALMNVQPEQAIVLDKPYMEQLLLNGPLVCIGSGVTKTKTLLEHPNLFFLSETYSLQTCIELATIKFNAKAFEDLAYSSPAYIKDFYQKPASKD